MVYENKENGLENQMKKPVPENPENPFFPRKNQTIEKFRIVQIHGEAIRREDGKEMPTFLLKLRLTRRIKNEMKSSSLSTSRFKPVKLIVFSFLNSIPT